MSFGILLLTVVVMTLVYQTSALPEYSSELQKIYGNDSCTTCHVDPNGGDNLTGYGTEFARRSNHVEYIADALKAIGEPPVKASIKISEYLLVLQGVYGNYYRYYPINKIRRGNRLIRHFYVNIFSIK